MQAVEQLASRMSGWPDLVLTAALLAAAAVVVLVALLAPAWAKALTLAYVVLP